MTAHAQLHQLSQQMQQCIQNCLDCHSICLSTVSTYCLKQGGHHAEAAHVRLMLDCAEICQTSANFMLRGSSSHARICGVGAEICERCASVCEIFADDAQMQACAEVCHRCAQSCRNMALAAV